MNLTTTEESAAEQKKAFERTDLDKDEMLITEHEEETLEKDGVVIHVVPAWKWLLGAERQAV